LKRKMVDWIFCKNREEIIGHSMSFHSPR
jgi:hypothetical protein